LLQHLDEEGRGRHLQAVSNLDCGVTVLRVVMGCQRSCVPCKQQLLVSSGGQNVNTKSQSCRLHAGCGFSADAIRNSNIAVCYCCLLLSQATQSSLNTAGLALIMQTVATGLLVTACIANEDYSGALGDGIQVRGAL
jgi:hypothetical protein